MGCANSTPAVTEEVGHPEKVVAALQTLRDSLSHLTPAGQTTVKQSHAFASAEWLDGMAALTKTTVNKGKETSISREASVHAGHQGAFQEARIKLTPDSSKLILVLVGLPARGKSLLGYKLESYLNWRGWRTRTFRVGELRRDQAAPVNDSSPTARPSSGAASFFDNRKAFAKLTREAVAEEAFAKLLTWLDTGGQIAIFDATNCTAARRAKLNELVKAHSAAHGAGAKVIGVVYIESIVTDPATIMAGMRWKIKHSPDFKGMDETEAMKVSWLPWRRGCCAAEVATAVELRCGSSGCCSEEPLQQRGARSEPLSLTLSLSLTALPPVPCAHTPCAALRTW